MDPVQEERAFLPKELSWLSFNERVLQEAADPTVPALQRLRFLGIFSSNMDEFYRVRFADVRRLATFSPAAEQESYRALLGQIESRVKQLQKRFDRVSVEVLATLRRHRIYLINEQQLDPHQADFAADFFASHVQPELEPVLLEDNHPLPELTDASIYLAIRIESAGAVRYAMLEVPTDRVGRFVELPPRRGKRGRVFIVLENIIRHSLPRVFHGIFPIDAAEAFTLKVTRDAELEIDDGITQTLIDKMSSSLKKRRKADPVRFVYDQAMPPDLLHYLQKRLGVGRYDSLVAGARYHNSKDFMSFPKAGPNSLEYKALPQLPLAALNCHENVFQCLQQSEALLHFPYHSFNYVTDFLKTAALDPAVRSIKISLYRVARQSHVIDALLNAVHNHKKVTAVVELQARFDEEANISWARRLTEGGVNVIFGIPGLKVHGKIISVARHESGHLRYYSYVGTGNFNEKTATLYTDFGLLTGDQEIGEEVAKVFDFIEFTYRRHDFKHLLLSPHSNRDGLMALMDAEIEAAHAGEPSGILIKCNNLVDERIINKLYEASQAGVPVRLIVRSMCSLVPGVPGLSENIRAISIVDRYLEHPRVAVFENRGKPRYHISSADLMTRNLDYRVEVTCPVRDPKLQAELRAILELQWHDNVKARVIDGAEANTIQRRGRTRIRSQEATHRFLETGELPAVVQRALQRSAVAEKRRAQQDGEAASGGNRKRHKKKREKKGKKKETSGVAA
jgi:polyphosphate kinase